ncbi:hypothetical protein [Clostridium tunisiense]|uniref:hypothetical protein n=1 Tax=Clostridium tunisiense TaxID=219748 RepID=UPI000313A5D1|nr:hypothetical protein [Clostridium tunisiense]
MNDIINRINGNYIVEKINLVEDISKQDIISLSFTPIMGGSLSKADKILKAIKLVKNIDKEYRYDIQSILYAFANKFIEGKDLEKVKDELKVTEFGKSLIEEGGKTKAIEIAKNLLDILSIEMIAKKQD